MRQIVIATVFALVAGTAHAGAAPSSVQSCIAVGSGAQRVAAIVANPADCCSGRLQCAQFLSTSRVVRPAHDQRT